MPEPLHVVPGAGRTASDDIQVAPTPAAGERDFALFCETCHGERGDGGGLLASTLTPPPARLADPALLRTRTDAELFQIIDQGGEAVGRSAGMAAWGGTFSPERIASLVAYIRQLQAAAEPEGADEPPSAVSDARSEGR